MADQDGGGQPAQQWYPRDFDATAGWHERGLRAPFESVHRDGQDITDIVPPAEWPEPYRSEFFELGWRPYTPAGITPVWHAWADGATDPTPSALELRRAAERARRDRGSAGR